MLRNGVGVVDGGGVLLNPAMIFGKMLLYLYSFLIVIVDVVFIFYKCVFAYVELLFRLVIWPPEKSVENDIILITGAGHGIGRELALQLGELGAIIVCWDINSESNDAVAKEIRHNGGRAYAFRCDISQRQEVERMADLTRTRVGDITVVINNAGIMPCNSILHHNHKEVERTMEINVMAHFWVIRAFLPRMIEMKRGHIVSLSSVAGLKGAAFLIPYCTSKFAARGMMDSLQEELRITGQDQHIHCTTIMPFFINTGLAKNPRSRFPLILNILDAHTAAKKIISGFRRNRFEVFIPEMLQYVHFISAFWPRKVKQTLLDFFDIGAEIRE